MPDVLVIYSRASHGMCGPAQNICKFIMAHSRSLLLNSYVMFQPSGPNFLRSWMIAWNMQMPNSMVRQSCPRSVNESIVRFTFFTSGITVGRNGL